LQVAAPQLSLAMQFMPDSYYFITCCCHMSASTKDLFNGFRQLANFMTFFTCDSLSHLKSLQFSTNIANLTFREPCIVIYSYNKSQRDALFLKFILVKNSTYFGQIYCPSSGVSTLYTQQKVFVMLVLLTVC